MTTANIMIVSAAKTRLAVVKNRMSIYTFVPLLLQNM